MAKLVDICVPDNGDFSDLPIIEILVKEGDEVALDDSVISIESDKATMDIPSSAAGHVEQLLVSVGDTVSAGQPLLKPRVDATSQLEQASHSVFPPFLAVSGSRIS